MELEGPHFLASPISRMKLLQTVFYYYKIRIEPLERHSSFPVIPPVNFVNQEFVINAVKKDAYLVFDLQFLLLYF